MGEAFGEVRPAGRDGGRGAAWAKPNSLRVRPLATPEIFCKNPYLSKRT